ncbi:hypothetical protein HNR77_003383 [Paenibacillus sp. JGP012]|uniref:hypothetical protein n=1 Tax=Paenibacillus sp. JGP012 TaxID=2735914 RepID=UPI0016105DCF|nr:hypothetical protein [Paenibacillus sp. JGP012]MBB6022286.1 hypothetical protein [Paenibacillus sp. JGP012]
MSWDFSKIVTQPYHPKREGIHENQEKENDEGTGKQQISDDQVFTTLKIIRTNWNKTPLALDEGSTIEAKEYFVVHRNLTIMGSQWIPAEVYSVWEQIMYM